MNRDIDVQVRLFDFNPALEVAQFAVYDHPSDYPRHYVVRKWVIDHEPVPTHQIMLFTDLGEVRRAMMGMGLLQLGRQPNDDPNLLEVWL